MIDVNNILSGKLGIVVAEQTLLTGDYAVCKSFKFGSADAERTQRLAGLNLVEQLESGIESLFGINVQAFAQKSLKPVDLTYLKFVV